MSLPVLFDHQIFSMQQSGGISRYYYELLKRFSQSPAMDLQLALSHTTNRYVLSDTALCDRYSISSPARSPLLAKTMDLYLRSSMGSPGNRVVARLAESKPRVFHPSYYGNYYIGKTGSTKVVVTVHDMIHEKFPELFAATDDTYLQKYRAVNSADHLICVSESTRQDLISFYGVSKHKTSVVHLGSSFEGQDNSVSPADMGCPYVLYVGSRDKYKNFHFSMWALARVFAQRADLKLVIFGGGGLQPAEHKFLQQVLGDRYIVSTDTSDDRLKQLYKGASALLFPSYYEGFGIPVLEAFTFGCPVVCSEASSVPEVGGDAAFYFEGKSIESLHAALEKALAARESSSMKIVQERHLAKFSWDRTAALTADIYRELGAG